MVHRIEEDYLGRVQVPEHAYYGAQTQRAIENFPISGIRMPRRFIRALGIVKLASVRANMRLGLIDERIGRAIERASIEVIEGRLDEHFPIDVFQTGSGPSSNMNANEVIANRACELLGGKKGDRSLVHPNEHVNRCQSSNDVIPSAIQIACVEEVRERLAPSLDALIRVLDMKASEFSRVVKAGRTHLRDAVPITLGLEFRSYYEDLVEAKGMVERESDALLDLPIGGTVIGTGLNAHPGFSRLVIEEIAGITGIGFR